MIYQTNNFDVMGGEGGNGCGEGKQKSQVRKGRCGWVKGRADITDTEPG